MTWTPPEVPAGSELRALLPEAGWRVAVGEVAARHGLAMEGAAPFASGSDVVWGLGGAVVKLTAPAWDWQIEAEAHWLGQVAGRLPVATPAVLARGELAGWPYVVMTRLPGRALGEAWPSLSRAERLRLAADLGETTRALHDLEVAGDAVGWDAFWATCRADVAARHARAGAPAHLVEAIPAFLERHDLATGPRVPLHTELLDQHVLVEERGGRLELSGLIDFADARLGPAEYEFAAPVEFVLRGEPGLLRAYLEAYGEPPSTLGPDRPARMLAWALSHRYGNLPRMLDAVAPAVPADLGQLAGLLYRL